MATHSSILGLENPRDGEPDGLPSMGSHRVGHDSSDLAATPAAAKFFSGSIRERSLGVGVTRMRSKVRGHISKQGP